MKNRLLSIILIFCLCIPTLLTSVSNVECSSITLKDIGEDKGFKNAFNNAIVCDCAKLMIMYSNGDGSGGNKISDSNASVVQNLFSKLAETINHIFAVLRSFLHEVSNKDINTYDIETSMRNFFNNKWLYDLQISDNYPLLGHVLANSENYPKIEQYLEEYNLGHHKDEILSILREYQSEAYYPEYNDVNFAEILSILSTSEQFNYYNCNFLTFNDFISNESNRRFYYELKMKWTISYGDIYVSDELDILGNPKETYYVEYGTQSFDSYESMTECIENMTFPYNEEFEHKGKILYSDYDHFYIEPELQPYGLREIYTMALLSDNWYDIYYLSDNSEEEKQKAYSEYVNSISETDVIMYCNDLYQYYQNTLKWTNFDMLDENEKWLRVYSRTDDLSIINNTEDAIGKEYNPDILGISYLSARSENSIRYDKLIEEYDEATGRSNWSFFEWGECFNLQDFNRESLNEYERQLLEDAQITGLSDIWDKAEFEDWLNSLPEDAQMLDIDFNCIFQGEFKNSYRGDTNYSIAQNGCCDCTLMMLAMMLTDTRFTKDDVKTISQNYVTNNALFETSRFASDFGIKKTSADASNPSGYRSVVGNFDAIKSAIDRGEAVSLNIKGHCEYEGRVYHKSNNGHFLTVIGYDQDGYYVYDPGSPSNTNNGPIPYEALVMGGLSKCEYCTWSAS